MTEPIETPGREPNDAHPGRLQLARRAAREGAADAQAAADRILSASGLFLSRFVYTTSYTVSYGIVLPATLVARSIPRDNAAVRGLIDGAAAAVLKVDEVRGLPIDAMSSGPLVSASAG